MTSEIVERIRARLEAARCGPWECERADEPGRMFASEGFYFVMAPDHDYEVVAQVPVPIHNRPWPREKAQAIARFVAKAPEDVAFLLAEIGRLERDLEKTRKECNRLRFDLEEARGKTHYAIQALEDFAEPLLRPEDGREVRRLMHSRAQRALRQIKRIRWELRGSVERSAHPVRMAQPDEGLVL